MKKTIALIAATATLAGCANIGTVNGVPVNRGTTVSSQGSASYCQFNPAICIVGGIVAVGVIRAIVNDDRSAGGGSRGTLAGKVRRTSHPQDINSCVPPRAGQRAQPAGAIADAPQGGGDLVNGMR